MKTYSIVCVKPVFPRRQTGLRNIAEAKQAIQRRMKLTKTKRYEWVILAQGAEIQLDK